MGKEDERHLWPEMFRAIREIKPRYVVGENVRGFLNWSNGLVLEEVYADLESEGYEVQSFVLSAVGINAPHRRDRVYIIAHANSDAGRGRPSEGGRTECEADSNGESSIYLGSQPNGNEGTTSNSERSRLEHGHQNRNIHSTLSETQGKQCESPDDTKTDDNVHAQQGGPSEAWTWFPIKSPLCSGDDGLPSELDGLTFSKWRKESIMGYGNAIVPQIALRIFRTIEKCDKYVVDSNIL